MTMQLEQVLGIINNLWQQIPQEYLIIFTFGGAGFALLNCFMGYRLRKVWGCLLGLLAGGAGGTAVGYYVLNDWVLALAAGAGCALIRAYFGNQRNVCPAMQMSYRVAKMRKTVESI